MNDKIFLNDLLNLTQNELERTKIKFNTHDSDSEPMQEYLKNPDAVNIHWLFWKGEKISNLEVGQIAICLVRFSEDTWLLTTIKEVTRKLNVQNGTNYEGVELECLRPYFGRILISYHKSHAQHTCFASGFIDTLEVLQILPSIYDGVDFPGYDKVRLSFEELSIIVHRRKHDWVAALENQKAVYLITDTLTGRQYVGSAYGDNGMLLKRWSEYVSDGHGGNKLLKELVDTEGFDYIKQNFQYSVLENYNARTDKRIILERESWWKATLGSRAFGLNSN